MSKLSFKEDGYYDGVGETEGEEDRSEEMNFSHDSDGEVKDSYSLFGIEPSSSALSTKMKKKNKEGKNGKVDAEIESVYSSKTGSSDDVDESAIEESKSAKKKRKKRKLSTTKHEDIESEEPVVKEQIGSSFLSKFLSKKREAAEVPEPPEIELPNDSFLRMFQDSFKSHQADSDVSALVESEDDEDSLPAYQSVGKKEGLKLSGIHMSDSNTSLYASTEADDESTHKEESSGPVTVTLQFFNLPYRISTEQLQAFGKRFGYKFTSVTMGVDWKTKLPSGSATIQVELPTHPGSTAHRALDLTAAAEDEPNLYGDPENDEVTDCIAALQGKDCGGRPLRVQRFVVKKRQSGSLGGRGDSRYFSGDISCKCHSCGQVGHRQQECTNEAVANPCHLCAGQDHDAGNCPNITCYRCGKFGHHSRDCTFASMAKPVICTNCGSSTHDSRNCRDVGALYNTDVLAPDSKVAGPHVRCMSCNQFGHIMCQTLPPVPAATAGEIYCPNCGLSGHHIDFPQLYAPSASSGVNGESAKKKARGQLQNAGPSLCMEPKYDAFIKYPQLLRDIDGVSNNERLSYFRDVTRRSSYGDQMLFPPIARQLAPFNNNISSAQGGSSAGRGGAPPGRHSLGGGGDNGRSVVIKYQDTPAQRSQSVGPRVQQSRSAQENTTNSSSLGKRKGFEPELASRYATLHPPPTQETRPALSSRGRDEGHRDRERDFSSGNNNNRRNSFPANGAGARGRPNEASGHNRFATPEPSRHQSQGSNHKNRPAAPSLPLPPMAAASAAWNEKIESRKRRFNE